MSSEVKNILEQYLETIWAAQTPIAYDNKTYTPVIGTAFIRCFLDGTFSETISLKCQREYYLFTIQVHTPSGKGSGANFLLADDLAVAFTHYASGNLTCKSVRIVRVGNRQEWYRRDVLIEVQFDNHF